MENYNFILRSKKGEGKGGEELRKEGEKGGGASPLSALPLPEKLASEGKKKKERGRIGPRRFTTGEEERGKETQPTLRGVSTPSQLRRGGGEKKGASYEPQGEKEKGKKTGLRLFCSHPHIRQQKREKEEERRHIGSLLVRKGGVRGGCLLPLIISHILVESGEKRRVRCAQTMGRKGEEREMTLSSFFLFLNPCRGEKEQVRGLKGGKNLFEQ